MNTCLRSVSWDVFTVTYEVACKRGPLLQSSAKFTQKPFFGIEDNSDNNSPSLV